MRKYVNRLLGIFLITFMFGKLGYLLHINHTVSITNIGCLGLLLFLIFRLSLKKSRSKRDIVKYAIAISYIFTTFIGVNHLPFPFPIGYLPWGLLIIWMVWVWINNEPLSELTNNLTKHPLIRFGFGLGVAGVLFQIMHWPGGHLLLIASFILFTIWIFHALIFKAI